MRIQLLFIAGIGLATAALIAQQPSTLPASAGEALFFGKAGCSGCHATNGRGGIVGPDLSAAGAKTAEELRAKILDPTGTVVVARLQDGREIQGVRRNEDTFTLQMMDASGQLHLLDKMKLAGLGVENRSLMPGDYRSRLSADEIQNLLAYLATLKERDITKTGTAAISGGVTYERLRNATAEPQNWMHYWGNYQGTHYSALKEITTANVSRLQAKWSMQLPGTSSLEIEPLVIDGIM